MTLMQILLWWIGVCTAAAVLSLALVWLIWKLVGQQNSFVSEDVDLKFLNAEQEVARLDAEIESLGRSCAAVSSLLALKKALDSESSRGWTRWSNAKDRFKTIDKRLLALEEDLEAVRKRLNVKRE